MVLWFTGQCLNVWIELKNIGISGDGFACMLKCMDYHIKNLNVNEWLNHGKDNWIGKFNLNMEWFKIEWFSGMWMNLNKK